MEREKYLQEVLDTSSFKMGVFNLIEAPCGCGKTTAAINLIGQFATKPKRALVLIDTVSGKQRLSKNPKLTEPYAFWKMNIGDAGWGERPGQYDQGTKKTIVSTYAYIGERCKTEPDLLSEFELIICDEAHNIVIFPHYSEEPNCASIARDALRRVVKGGKTLVIGMTATPKKFMKEFGGKIETIEIDQSCLHRYHNENEIPYSSLTQIIRSIPKDWRGCIYTTRITEMKKIEKMLIEEGRNPICIWSLSNQDHPMTDEQKSARDYMLDKEEVPPEYDVLIFNASNETSINLRGRMEYCIVHSTEEEHRIQARGRYRGNLMAFYYLDHDAEVTITVRDEWLDRKLFSDDWKKFKTSLGIKDKKGHVISNNDLIKGLEDSGYSVQMGRNQLRYKIITKK